MGEEGVKAERSKREGEKGQVWRKAENVRMISPPADGI